MKREIQGLFIDKKASLKKAMLKMDELGCKLLIVVDNDIFHSLLSIGDIQRAIIRENNLDLEVEQALRSEVKIAFEHDDLEQTKAEMRRQRTEFMPVLTKDGHVQDVIFWEDLFKEETRLVHENINLPVVIMAGGQGTRLKPITNIFPKALIPLGEKTILERIMDSFKEIGSNRFFISINYKAEMIQYYLEKLSDNDYNVQYIKELSSLGTAGSLSLLKGVIDETFFISNCDILIDQDYGEILHYHRKNKNEITLVAAIKHFPIPYGILKTRENGLLEQIEEKPDLSFKINTGLYVTEPSVLNEIPENTHCDMTEIIDTLKTKGCRVGVFPVSEKSWQDIGTWNEYLGNTHFNL